MFFQIKAIRKGSKPAIWRRAYIPSNITFAQLALLLEIILEYDESDMYEFEFFQKKDRMIEWHEGDQNLHDFYYSYLNAPDTYINEWLMNKEWFTFRLRKTGPDVPEYRVETEKVLKSIQFQDDGQKELSYPVIFKEVSVKNDRFWSDINVINETLKNKYFTRKTDADYMYISELRTCIREGQGIAICDEMINRDIHTKKSANSALKELTDNILSPFIIQKMEEFKKEIDHDEETGEILSSEEDVKKTTEKFMADVAVEMKQAFCVFSSGGMLSDYMDIVNEKDVAFDSDKQVERFASLAMQVNNNTRMYELKGHKPLEMRMGMSDFPNGKKPTIVPMSGLAAQMLESGKSQLAAMGIDIDTKSTGTDIPVIHCKGGLNGKAETSMKKVYPNDLCPCGSGLKYKRCCGRR